MGPAKGDWFQAAPKHGARSVHGLCMGQIFPLRQSWQHCKNTGPHGTSSTTPIKPSTIGRSIISGTINAVLLAQTCPSQPAPRPNHNSPVAKFSVSLRLPLLLHGLRALCDRWLEAL